MLVSTLIPADVRFAQRYSPHKWYPSSLQTATIGCLPRVFVHIIISIIVDTRSFHLLIFDHNDNSQMNSQSHHNGHYQSELDASNFFLSLLYSFIPSLCLSLFRSVNVSVFLAFYLSVCVSVYLSVYLPFCPSISLSVCIYVCLLICFTACFPLCLFACIPFFLASLESSYFPVGPSASLSVVLPF